MFVKRRRCVDKSVVSAAVSRIKRITYVVISTFVLLTSLINGNFGHSDTDQLVLQFVECLLCLKFLKIGWHFQFRWLSDI